MSAVRIVRDYPHSPAKVWRVLTEPALMALWGMRPEGYQPVAGTRFKLIGKPNKHWRGFVECVVLEAHEPSLLRYSWVGDDGGSETFVTYTLQAHAGGTRLRLEHSGFTGLNGLFMTHLIMGPGWRKMLDGEFPAVLDGVDDAGQLRAGSSLQSRF
jgi:uncharacterized protein YndB with AHSA1/START domain